MREGSIAQWRVAAAGLAMAAGGVLAQSTALTYQGQLKDNGVNANGLYDLRFRLYDAPVGGSQPGGTLCADNVTVADGRFTVVLDFGQQFASPAPRYLEIESRRDTGLSCGNLAGFTLLSPRQLLTAAPLANHAKSAFALDAADGSPLNAVYVDSVGNVGMGTLAPATRLHLLGNVGGTTPGEGLRIQGSSAGVDNLAYASFHNGAGVPIGYVGDGSSGDNTVFLAAYVGDVVLGTVPGGRVLTATAAGQLRLGTSSGDYRQFVLGGGNSEGFLYGSYPRFGDGIHLGYNYYADAAGSDVILHVDGGTSRVSMGYDRISFAASPAFGGAPVERAYVDSTGLRVVPTTRIRSVHGTKFLPDVVSRDIGGFGYYDVSGVTGYGIGSGGFVAPVELPDGATVTQVDVTYIDSRPGADFTVVFGRQSLMSTGGPVALGSGATSGSSALVRSVSFGVGHVVDNSRYAYYLHANLGSFGSELHKILGVKISYTVTSPLP